MLGLSGVTRTPRVRSLIARELPLAVEGYLVYCIATLVSLLVSVIKALYSANITAHVVSSVARYDGAMVETSLLPQKWNLRGVVAMLVSEVKF